MNVGKRNKKVIVTIDFDKIDKEADYHEFHFENGEFRFAATKKNGLKVDYSIGFKQAKEPGIYYCDEWDKSTKITY